MNNWKDKIKQFYDNLNQEKGFHRIKDLCSLFLEKPHASFWENKEKSEVIKYIEDWIDVSEYKLKFHNKWAEMHNMYNVIGYGEKRINKAKELLSLLNQE